MILFHIYDHGISNEKVWSVPRTHQSGLKRQIRLAGVVLQCNKPVRRAAYWLCKESSCNKERSPLCQHHLDNSNCIYLQHMCSWLFISAYSLTTDATVEIRRIHYSVQIRAVQLGFKNL